MTEARDTCTHVVAGVFPSKMDRVEYRQHLVDEANTSVAFANSLATIGVAIVGYLLQQQSLDRFDTSILLSILLVFSSFFASIFYANVTGCIRHSGEFQALVPMCYGNALTEYLGVYLLVALFPLVVHGVTLNLIFATAAAGVTFASLCVYHVSGFDLLARAFVSTAARAVVLGLFGLLVAFNLASIVWLGVVGRYAACCALVLFLLFLTIQDVRVMVSRRDAT